MSAPASWPTAAACLSSAVVCALASCTLDRDGIEASEAGASAGGAGTTTGTTTTGPGGGGAGDTNCGDGVTQPAEACDDGNAQTGDGCSAACEDEDDCPGGHVVLLPGMPVVIQGDAKSATHGHAPEACGTGLGADHVYAVETPQGGAMRATLVGPDGALMYLRTTCATAGAEIGCDGAAPLELGAIVAARATTWVVVDHESAGARGDFELTLSLSACGDGAKSATEECDDGNLDPDDGCNACVLDCGPGQFKDAAEGHCYQYFGEGLTWYAAKDACQTWGGALAVLTTMAERALVLPQIGAAETWIGATDDSSQGTSEGTWIWITGEPFTAMPHVAPWHPAEPTGTLDENCAEIRGDALFNDLDCGDDRTFLCERVP